ncbi:hypothetical protein [Aliarcobacter butzleri]|uniref:hypothetical protein n=1 Tax=Aliarcobacter butzleri TaxID=28197 RepID=UPI00263C8966|nr:hypothetical protein [Aliarcobacter butzleri]MDN5095810.1 hypothetical protein [Aliarcobacter butzleri]
MKNRLTLEFQKALQLGNHLKALEIRDEYLLLTQEKSKIKHKYLREFYYLLEESDDLELLVKYHQYKDFSNSQKYLLSNKIAKLLVPINYEKAFEYSQENEIKYLVAKEIAKKDFSKAQILIDEIDELSFYYGYLVFSLIFKNCSNKEIENLITDLDLAREQKKVTLDDYQDSLIKIAIEVFEKFPEISETILNKFKSHTTVPSSILDLQVLVAIKKSKDDFENIIKYLDEVDDLDFIKAKIILEIVKIYKNDIDKVINSIFLVIDKFHSDFIKYDIFYNIQKIINKDYSQKLKELSKNLQFDDDNINFDEEIWLRYFINRGNNVSN